MIQCFAVIKSTFLVVIVVHAVHSVSVEKWFNLNDSQIFIERDYKYNWFQARNECLRKNMTLISVETSQKSAALTRLLRGIFAKSHNLWVGADDLAAQDDFVWSSTGKRFEFTNWSPFNPSHNNGNERCVNIWDNSDFEWNDAPCNELKGFICEVNHFAVEARMETETLKNILQKYYGDCDE